MINFKKIEIDDKRWIDPLLTAADMRGCQHNFTNLFAWSEIYRYRVARVDDYLVVKGEQLDKTPYYLYPAGQGDPQSVIRALQEDAVNCGYGFTLAGLSTENIAVLNSLFPRSFEYIERRDSFDYVYLLDKLVTLSGDKSKSKRNHVNYFKKHNNWSFEPIGLENLAECWEMNKQWCKVHGCQEDNHLANENCAVMRCFDNFIELGLEGGLLRSEGRVVAYTMGDKLNSDTYDIHIEKAFGEIHGAYQIINQEFTTLIQKLHPELIYVNREEDMGIEGLRKAKLSYHPVKMEVKYWGELVRL
ncbi:MAG: DUF2156 domain-containing protein [Methylocystaceae bacterium]